MDAPHAGSADEPAAAPTWPPIAPSPAGPPPMPGRPTVAAPRQRGWPWLVVAVLTPFVGAGLARLANHAGPAAGDRPAAHATVTAPAPISATPVTTTPSTPATPSAGDALDDALQAQAKALLAGDEKGFMAAVDPKATRAVADFERLYRNLRALRVAAWAPRLNIDPGPLTSPTKLGISVTFCLVRPDCVGSQAAMIVTVALHDGRPLIEAYAPPATGTNYPYPWQVSSLHVVTGKRVMLAAAAEAGHLAEVLPVAEKSAPIDDRYAQWGKPTMYVVFLASTSESTTWFGGMVPGSYGQEFPISRDDNQVIIKLSPYLTGGHVEGVRTVLQHEMGHVATLLGAVNYREDSLIEGIATYISFVDNPDWPPNPALPDLTRYIRAGRWSGTCYASIDQTSGDDTEVGAGYDLGYLTIRYLVDVYGRAKMLDFWAAVERAGQTPEVAATDTLGKPWDLVNADCATYVHHAVHA